MVTEHPIKELPRLQHQLCLSLAWFMWQGASIQPRRIQRDHPQKASQHFGGTSKCVELYRWQSMSWTAAKSFVGKPAQFTELTPKQHAHANHLMKWEGYQKANECWVFDFSKLKRRQEWEVTWQILYQTTYLLQTLSSSQVITVLGKMRAICDSKVSHDQEFIQQEKHINHNR